MSTRNCRRTSTEREQHERAVRIRKMTDVQLCEYIDDLEAGNRPAAPNQAEIVADFLASFPGDDDAALPLGTYENEARAMEVLEEIAAKYEEFLKSDGGYNPFSGNSIPPTAFSHPKVYRMPEK